MEPYCSNRRDFLLKLGGAAGVALLQAHWPEIAAAAEHAHQVSNSNRAATFEVLTPEQGKEVEAITARIIPSDGTPGAREAGVVYFIDRILKGFASDTKPLYDKGIVAISSLAMKMYPATERFSAATPEQQDRILGEFVGASQNSSGRFGTAPSEPDFFQTITFHTVFGYLVDPSGGGNRDYVGWKAIGRDPAPGFMPPFGFYDKDYPGWQPVPDDTSKT